MNFVSREPVRPFLKWAGGKTQMLSVLVRHVPPTFGRYIEPFVGAGAMFFYLRPEHAVIADTNPELVNCYRVVKSSVEELMYCMREYPFDEAFYYELRSRKPDTLTLVERAARFIYLNKTCFNGLHRVNKAGDFNVPFGRQKNPKICDDSLLRAASEALQNTVIEEGDYRKILEDYARPGDFVYLDPPYYPVSAYADFKRYTKDFFYEEDHVVLACETRCLAEKQVKFLLTNSCTEFTKRLYEGFPYEIVDTKRSISCNGASRRSGQDLVVIGTKAKQRTTRRKSNLNETLTILERFPSTRYMGSKYNVLDFIWESVKDLDFHTVLDAFSGSGCVSYLFKTKGKQVCSNDLMHMCYHTANALVANNSAVLTSDDLAQLLLPDPDASTFIRDTFPGLYYSDEDNAFLDLVRFNIDKFSDAHKRSLALSALVRACLKKRPRGIFTYVGERYQDNRPDLRLSLSEHFPLAISDCNRAVFDNGQQNTAFNSDVFSLDVTPDLVYLDPPYYSPHSDSDYVRRYHFVEGLVRYWEGVEIQAHCVTKKFRKYDTLFDGRESTLTAFRQVFEKFRDSIIVVSYSSNSLPSKSDLADMLKRYKANVRVVQISHMYSFGTQRSDNANDVDEYVFIGY